MEPISLLIMCMVLSAIFVGKTAEGVIHAAKGTTPPSLQRERERLAAEQKRFDTLRDISKETGEPVEYTRPYTWGNVLGDASNLAAMVAGRALQKRQHRLTDEARAHVNKWVQDAQDRLMDAYGYGPRGSADSAGAPAASAPDALDTDDKGDPTADKPAEPATTDPDAVPVVPDAGAGPGMAGGAVAGAGKCNWREVRDEAQRPARACERAAAGNDLSLCADDILNVPGQATVVRKLAEIAGRCHWIYKEFTHADLRCTQKVEHGGEIDGKPWSFCRSHRCGSAVQLRISTALDQREQEQDQQPQAAPVATPPPAATEPATDNAPSPNSTPPANKQPKSTGPCNWKTWAGVGAVSICTTEAHESSVAGLCQPHEQQAPQVASLMAGGEVVPDRCTWTFKQLPFGVLRCTNSAAGGTTGDEKSLCCENHGGTADNAAANPDDNQQKEEADGPTDTPTCTRDMNCKSCVQVDGKPVCRSDLPQESRPAGDNPPPADSPGPTATTKPADTATPAEPAATPENHGTTTATTGDTTMTSATDAQPNAEIDGITAAINYTADSAQTARDNMNNLDEEIARQQGLVPALEQAADAIDTAVAAIDSKNVTGEARDELDGTAREAMREAAAYGLEIADLQARQREALERAAVAYDASSAKLVEYKTTIGEAYAATGYAAGTAGFVTDGAVQD